MRSSNVLRALMCVAFLSIVAGCGSGNSVGDDNEPVTPEPEPPSADSEALLHLNYNELVQGTYVKNTADDDEYLVTNAFGSPELVPGVEGKALRTDGYSTWISTQIDLDIRQTLTVETWVALESYPSDHEVAHRYLSPSSFINQRDESSGFSLDINTFGQWEFVVFIGGIRHTVKAEEPFPLYEWAHIAAVVDTPNGRIRLYLNGDLVTEHDAPVNGTINVSREPLTIAKSNQDTHMGIFLVNALNGAFDQTRIYPGARTQQHIQNSVNENIEQVGGEAHASLVVPEGRFAHDLQRPRLHAMPPANWANEAHGLIQVGDRFHMFYQRTPNGPFKTQMHWGHMYSDDLIAWHHDEDALWPTLEDSDTEGFDMKGIWSGDVVYDQGTAYAFYTNVNHSGSYNPGIALATSTDENLRNWEKHGPLIDTSYVDDFRDPYLWNEGDTWHMLIGAKVNGRGGLDYYRSHDLLSWERRPRFTNLSNSQMDIGSDVWEMPVFEALGGGKHILVVNPVGGQVSKYDQDNPTRGVYWIGTWNGNVFTPDFTTPKNLDVIEGHLSPTVTRDNDGAPVGIGIVDERRSSQAQLDAGWAHTFSFPRKWRLLDDGETLGQAPLAALEGLRDWETHQKSSHDAVSGEQGPVAKGRQQEVLIEIDAESAASDYGLVLGASADGSEKTILYYDSNNQQVVLNKSLSSVSGEVEDKGVFRGDYDESAFGKPDRIHLFIDHSVVDVFINNSAAFSFRIYPEGVDSDHIFLYSSDGDTNFVKVESWSLIKPELD